MANKLYIQGQDYTSFVKDGLDNLSIEIGLNTSTKTVGNSLSTDLTAEKDLYERLKETFFDTCDSWQNKLLASFRTDICGGQTIPSQIDSVGVEWCPRKEEIKFNLKSADQVSECYNRLNSEYITDNGFIENNETPIMYYADQPNWMQWALLLTTTPIRFFLNRISTVMNIIIDVVNAIPIPFVGDIGRVDLSDAVFSGFDDWITGLGRWTVTPLVREMISYQADNCGLKFQSSILNDPGSSRYNLSMFCLTGGEHGDYKDKKPTTVNIAEVFELNKPLYTTIDLLNELSQVFNADYRIIGDTLYFERYDWFYDNASQELLNTSEVCPDDDICISWKTEDACAYGDYAYTADAYDSEGNGVMRLHYQDKVEYNKPYNPAQKGKCERKLNFSPARFMYDVKLYNSSGFFNFKKLIDDFRDGSDSFIADILLHNEGLIRKTDLVVSGGTLTTHKLLILENNFDYKDARTIKEKYGVKDGKQYYIFNKPMHIDADADYNELYTDFLFMDNPRLKPDKYEISDFTIDCDCSVVEPILQNFQKLHIRFFEGGKSIKVIPQTIKLEIKDSKVSIEFSECIGLC